MFGHVNYHYEGARDSLGEPRKCYAGVSLTLDARLGHAHIPPLVNGWKPAVFKSKKAHRIYDDA
jgi:hypothetical protein